MGSFWQIGGWLGWIYLFHVWQDPQQEWWCTLICSSEREVWRTRWHYEHRHKYWSQPFSSMQEDTLSAHMSKLSDCHLEVCWCCPADIPKPTDGDGWKSSNRRITSLWVDSPVVASDVVMEDNTNGNDAELTSDDEMELSWRTCHMKLQWWWQLLTLLGCQDSTWMMFTCNLNEV